MLTYSFWSVWWEFSELADNLVDKMNRRLAKGRVNGIFCAVTVIYCYVLYILSMGLYYDSWEVYLIRIIKREFDLFRSAYWRWNSEVSSIRTHSRVCFAVCAQTGLRSIQLHSVPSMLLKYSLCSTKFLFILLQWRIIIVSYADKVIYIPVCDGNVSLFEELWKTKLLSMY